MPRIVWTYRWEGSSSTARSFDGGDVLFIEQNPYADFSSTAWDESATEDYADLFSWLDETVMSSAAQCYALEDLYEECVDMVRSEGEVREQWGPVFHNFCPLFASAWYPAG